MKVSPVTKACIMLNMADFPRDVLDAFVQHVRPLSELLSIGFDGCKGRVPVLDKHISFLLSVRDSKEFQEECRVLGQEDISVVTRFDPEYPALLKEIYHPPLALYVRGAVECLSDFCVAVVGSRRASSYGMSVAEKFAYTFAQAGVTVVSGFARGIDTACCTGVVHARGKTIAVLGSGLACVYPQENKRLVPFVQKYQGAVISEFPLMTPPLPFHFPRRNRIISGLSKAVVVVEAAQRSGALITAGCAVEQNREVFAVPGNITTPLSAGTHALIKDGAALVNSAEEVLEELRYQVVSGARGIDEEGRELGARLNEEEMKVYSALEEEKNVEELIGTGGLTAPRVLHALMTLKTKCAIEELPGKVYRRR